VQGKTARIRFAWKISPKHPQIKIPAKKATAMSTTPSPTSPWLLARRAAKMNPSVIREILKVTEKPGIISFAGGLPSPKTFPGGRI
jgi:DNA-binding transcriptional MocR family regulator